MAADLPARLARAFHSGDIVTPGEAERPATRDAAVQVFDAATAQLGPVAAWKLGATIQAVREMHGLDRPFFGGLPADCVFRDGAALTHVAGRLRGVECEYGFALARDVRPGDAGLEEAAFQALFANVHPCFEIPGSRFATLGEYRGLGLVADFGAAGVMVIGPGQDLGDVSRLDDAEVVLEIDGTRAVTGSAAVIDGGAFGPVRGFVRDALSRGYALRAGQVIVTGSCTGYVVVPPDVPVAARFAALNAAVSCRFGVAP